MSVTLRLYTSWKEQRGFTSDRQALSALGVSHGAAVHWKAGRNADVDVIEKMARDLGENAELAIIEAMKEQAKGDAAKTWSRVEKHLKTALAAALLIVPFSSMASVEKPANSAGYEGSSVGYVYYVKI